MEELQEADVLWPDAAHQDRHGRQHLTDDQQPRRGELLRQSPPVRIPSMPQQVEARPTSRRHPAWTRGYYDDSDDDGDVRGASSSSGAEAGIVPPHVLAARRCAGERRVVASSVCVGHGRTLKGRDLRAVRNAVLHMTGFLSSSDDKY
ncbi:hypothetical protein BS78_03G275100 [Paspalum vaginatum]|nr:hypothetical protein BS78_03G275100 [Paspalum vaginatum]